MFAVSGWLIVLISTLLCILLVKSGTITCEGDGGCARREMTCTVGEHCHVYCEGAKDVCREAEIECAADQPCDVYCSGEAACLGLVIDGRYAQGMNIYTDGNYRTRFTHWRGHYRTYRGFTTDDDSDNNTSNTFDAGHIVFIIFICITLVLLIIAYRKNRKLQFLLSSQIHKESIDLQQTKPMDRPPEIINNIGNNNENNAETEVEFNFDTKKGQNNTPQIIADNFE